MTEHEKALLQVRHRLEEAQARDRKKERSARTRRLIQKGAIIESVMPETNDMTLDELREYLYKNKQTVSEFLQAELPQIKLVPSQATYLLWLDCRKLPHPAEGTLADALEHFLRKEAGVYLTSGSEYGQSGDEFLRLNIATSRERLTEGMNRLKAGIEKYMVEDS